MLASAKVAVVGAGGVGMLLVQLLARLGVGYLVVIDPERVDPANLPRLPEATRLDAMKYPDREGLPPLLRHAVRRLAARKVRIGRRITGRASPETRFVGIAGNVADDHVARRITDSDFIFLSADIMLARTVVNQIAYQYLIPTLQVGSKPVIRPDTGEVLDTYAVVRTLGTAPGRLSCNGLIGPARLSQESLGSPQQVANQRYVDDPSYSCPERHHSECSRCRLGGQRLHAVHDRPGPASIRIPYSPHPAPRPGRTPRHAAATRVQFNLPDSREIATLGTRHRRQPRTPDANALKISLLRSI
jgi:ThiF family